MTANNLTIDVLKNLIHYDENSGFFFRKLKNNRRKQTGTKTVNGYIVISVNNVKYTGHRLAWFYVNNVWPTNDIDHIDGNRINNSFKNLREVTRSVNMQNMKKAKSNNISGFLGVRTRRNKFEARIKAYGKNIYLGTFDNAKEAHDVYLEFKRIAHEGCTI